MRLRAWLSNDGPNAESPITADPERWLDEHGDVLYRYALGRVSNVATAEDLVQETLLSAFKGAAKFRGASSERTWLIGILKHKTLDHLRRAGREVTYAPDQTENAIWDAKFGPDDHWVNAPHEWSDPSSLLEHADIRQQLRQCVDALPDKLRTLFVLREIEGIEAKELLETLRISSPNNLWVMMSRARERLRTCLQQAWQQP